MIRNFQLRKQASSSKWGYIFYKPKAVVKVLFTSQIKTNSKTYPESIMQWLYLQAE